ncbi:MAG: beta-ketoacyl-[acyl-carrier-protein] synthase family protein, partial [Verrucomicrobiota bacterium]
RQAARIDRAGRMLLLAANEALEQAQWPRPIAAPVILGTTSGGMTLGESYYRQAIENPRSRKAQAPRVTHYLVHRQGLDLCDAFDLRGPITIIANACASGANAIGHAYECVRSGRFERALVGGYDALSQMVFSGFDSLQALSPTQCRPFDSGRDGLALGEGAAILTLELFDVAEKRGATILGEIIGYGASTDGHHLTQPHPQGNAAFRSMTEACRSAGLEPHQIDYINAHGTGTPLNDAAEAEAIVRWAGDHAQHLPVSSTKASIGHLLGAAGAIEVVICLMALREQWLPPMKATRCPDAAVRFPLVTEPKGARLNTVLTNSFGFGGANASLILRKV